MSYNQYNLEHLTWQRGYSSLTGQEFLDLLIYYGYCPVGTTTNPAPDIDDLRPDGVISNLHYNGGQGYLIQESPAIYVGKIFKDPGQLTYATSSLYHKSPWLIKSALEAVFNQDKYLFFSQAGLTDNRIDEISDPEPQTSAGNPLSSYMFNWGSSVPDPPQAKIGFEQGSIDWQDGSNPAIPTGATLRPPASVESLMANTTSPHRFARPYSEYAKYYTGGAWRYLNRDGLVNSWSGPPGLWMDTWETLSVAKWDAWCSAWDAWVTGGHEPIDVMIWNGEYVQRFDQIKADSHTFAAPNGNPGKFDGPSNGIVSDSRWNTTWPQIGIEDQNGNSLWHMGDTGNQNHWSNWNVYNDVRSSLFNAWEKEYRYNKYKQLVDIAKQYPAFSGTKFLMFDMWEYAGITYECGDPVGQQLVAPGHGLEIPSTSWYGGYRAKEFRWGQNTWSSLPQDDWNSFTNGVSFFRSMQAATNKDKAYWMSSKGYNQGSDTNLYREVFFHAMLMKSDDLIILYSHGIQQSEWPDLAEMLDELDEALESSNKRDLLQPRVSYFDPYVVSTADVGGRFLSRLTPHPDAEVNISTVGDVLRFTFTLNGTKVLDFPTGEVILPVSPSYGYWIEQTSLISPGVLASGETFYYVGGAGTASASDDANWASSSGGAGGAGVPGVHDTVILDSYTVGTVTLNLGGTLDKVWVKPDTTVRLFPGLGSNRINVLKNEGTVHLDGALATSLDSEQVLGDGWLEFGDIQNSGTVYVSASVLIRGGISENSGSFDCLDKDSDFHSFIVIGSPGGTIAPGDYSGITNFGMLTFDVLSADSNASLVTDMTLNQNIVMNFVPGTEYKFHNLCAGAAHFYNCTTNMRDVVISCDAFLFLTKGGFGYLDISGSEINIGTDLEQGSLAARSLIIGTDPNISLEYDLETVFRVNYEVSNLVVDIAEYCQVSSQVMLPEITLEPRAKLVLGSFLSSNVSISTLTQQTGSEVICGLGDVVVTNALIGNWECQDGIITYGGVADIVVTGDFDFSGYLTFTKRFEALDLDIQPSRFNLEIQGDLTVHDTVLDRDHETVLDTPIRSFWSGMGGRAQEIVILNPLGDCDVRGLESYYVISTRPFETQDSVGCWNIGFWIQSNCPQREDAIIPESSTGAGTPARVIPEYRDPERVKIDRLWRS